MTKAKPARKPRLIETLAAKATQTVQHKCAVWAVFENESEAAEYLEALRQVKRA